MDYEKAYKDALEKAKSVIKECGDNKGRISMIESIFPELKENENERIRKAICDCVKWFGSDSIYFKYVSQENCLAWLEKQGEQNNIVEQLTAFAIHLQKRGAFRDDLCMDFEHEAQSFIEMQKPTELC